MNAKIQDSTVKRISETIDQPISRGLDKAVNDCLDQLDELKEKQNGNSFDMRVCDETKQEMSQNA